MNKTNNMNNIRYKYCTEWSASALISILSKHDDVKESINNLINDKCDNWNTKPKPLINNIETNYRDYNPDFLYSFSESMLSDNGIVRIPDVVITDNNDHTLQITTDWCADTVGYLDNNLLFICTPYPSYKKPARINMECVPHFTFTKQPQRRRMAEFGGRMCLEDEIAPITLSIRHNPVKFIDKYRDILEHKGFDMTVLHIVEGNLIKDEKNCDIN